MSLRRVPGECEGRDERLSSDLDKRQDHSKIDLHTFGSSGDQSAEESFNSGLRWTEHRSGRRIRLFRLASDKSLEGRIDTDSLD